MIQSALPRTSDSIKQPVHLKTDYAQADYQKLLFAIRLLF